MSQSSNEAITARTRYCAVYGHPIQHSASPAMQNAGFASLGLHWRYLAFEVPPGDLRSALAGAGAMRFIGLNLTVPHKLLAFDLMDELDESARTWGAVNTVCFETQTSGAWRPLREVSPEKIQTVRSRGYNTDADAIIQAVQEDLAVAIRSAKVLVLGAGGAGRVAALRLAAESAGELYLVNRTASKAASVAAEIQKLHPSVKVVVGYPESGVDLVINATSLGLKPEDEIPLDGRAFSIAKAGAVYDMIYRPAETPLLRLARAKGCRAANGLSMLLYQGAKALEIWTGQPAPVPAMRRALEEHIYGRA